MRRDLITGAAPACAAEWAGRGEEGRKMVDELGDRKSEQDTMRAPEPEPESGRLAPVVAMCLSIASASSAYEKRARAPRLTPTASSRSRPAFAADTSFT
jgi:hypothetical protein